MIFDTTSVLPRLAVVRSLDPTLSHERRDHGWSRRGDLPVAPGQDDEGSPAGSNPAFRPHGRHDAMISAPKSESTVVPTCSS